MTDVPVVKLHPNLLMAFASMNIADFTAFAVADGTLYVLPNAADSAVTVCKVRGGMIRPKRKGARTITERAAILATLNISKGHED